MVQITVSDDLARAIAVAGPVITLVDSQGRKLGCVTRAEEMSAERLGEIERRMQESGKYVSYQTIKERLGW